MNNEQQEKIKNVKTEVPQTPQMNDRDFVNDLLSTEKYLTSSYSVALNEASHDSLHQDLLTIFNETQNAQRDLFELMFQKGWYTLEAEDDNKIQQAYQQYQSYASQFPYSNQ